MLTGIIYCLCHAVANRHPHGATGLRASGRQDAKVHPIVCGGKRGKGRAGQGYQASCHLEVIFYKLWHPQDKLLCPACGMGDLFSGWDDLDSPALVVSCHLHLFVWT